LSVDGSAPCFAIDAALGLAVAAFRQFAATPVVARADPTGATMLATAAVNPSRFRPKCIPVPADPIMSSPERSTFRNYFDRYQGQGNL
jgi:hypothetical protein